MGELSTNYILGLTLPRIQINNTMTYFDIIKYVHECTCIYVYFMYAI